MKKYIKDKSPIVEIHMVFAKGLYKIRKNPVSNFKTVSRFSEHKTTYTTHYAEVL